MAIFRYTEDTVNNYYAYLIEGHGDDLNDGLTPETAVATMNRLGVILNAYTGAKARRAVIVKKKIYNEGFTTARTVGRIITFEFINNTIIDGSGSLRPGFLAGDTLINGRIINYGVNPVCIGGANIVFIECYIKNCTILQSTGSSLAYIYYHNSVIENVTPAQAGNRTSITSGDKNVFVGKILAKTGCIISGLKNSIFFNCEVTGMTALYPDRFDLDYCCIFNSTIGGKTHQDMILDGININGIDVNPQINDFANKVYTTASASPCSYRGEEGVHIGIGEAFYINSLNLFNQAETLKNIQIQNNRMIRIDDSEDGLYESFIISLNGTRIIRKVEFAALIECFFTAVTRSILLESFSYLTYDSTITYHKGSGVVFDGIKYQSKTDDNLSNQPDISIDDWEKMTYESGVAYPVNKIIEYTDGKWYKSNAVTSTTWISTEWNQVLFGDYITFEMKVGKTYSECQNADYQKFIADGLLLEDINKKGNADKDFDFLTQTSIRMGFIKLRIMFKNIR